MKIAQWISLSLKWQLAYILLVFPSIPHDCNEQQTIISSNSKYLQKAEIKPPSRNLILVCTRPVIQKLGLGSLGTNLKVDGRSQVLSILTYRF